MLRPVHLLLLLVAMVVVAYAEENIPENGPKPQEPLQDDLAADASGWGYSRPSYGRYYGGGWRGGWNNGWNNGWNGGASGYKGWGWGGRGYGGRGYGYGGWW